MEDMQMVYDSPDFLPNHLVLGMCGYKGSGKNTAATMIRDVLADTTAEYREYSFARAIRDVCVGIFGHLDGLWYNDARKEESFLELGGNTPRFYLRNVGMALRELDTDFWCKQVLNAYRKECQLSEMYISHKTVHVVTDLRFRNEWQTLRTLNAYMIYIDRGYSSDGHASEDLEWRHEVPADRIITIQNTGTMGDLQAAVTAAVNPLVFNLIV